MKRLMVAVVCLCIGAVALGADRPDGGPKGNDAGAPNEEMKAMFGAKPSVTTGTLTPAGAGGAMSYTATAGYLPLNDEQGKLRANVFYVS